jgi:hypothetical protein
MEGASIRATCVWPDLLAGKWGLARSVAKCLSPSARESGPAPAEPVPVRGRPVARNAGRTHPALLFDFRLPLVYSHGTLTGVAPRGAGVLQLTESLGHPWVVTRNLELRRE